MDKKEQAFKLLSEWARENEQENAVMVVFQDKKDDNHECGTYIVGMGKNLISGCAHLLSEKPSEQNMFPFIINRAIRKASVIRAMNNISEIGKDFFETLEEFIKDAEIDNNNDNK